MKGNKLKERKHRPIEFALAYMIYMYVKLVYAYTKSVANILIQGEKKVRISSI